jgi:hypothetical protein
MKKLFTLLAITSLAVSTQAQTYCESFDSQTVTLQESAHTFNTFGNGNGGFLNDWNVASGTPSVYSSGQLAGVNAYDGNQFVLTAVCDASDDYSEGLSLQHSFLQGNTYNVSLVMRNRGSGVNPTPIDIEFVLLGSPIPYTYQTNTGCSPTPAIPNGSLTVHTESSFATDSWQVINFTISNLPADYQNIWIRSFLSQGAPFVTTFLLMDAVCIETVVPSTCYMFDEQAITSPDIAHAFNTYGNGNSGFLEDWNVVSGTPSIYYNGSLGAVNAFEGTQFALSAVCDAGSAFNESVSLEYNFQQGNNYNVSMAIRNYGSTNNPTPIDIDYILLENPIAYTYNTGTGCSAIPAAPVASDTVHAISSFNQNAWQVINFNVTNLATDYSNLWFRAKFSSGAPLVTTFFLFDSVCVTQINEPIGITETQEQLAITVFPNPTNGTVTIETSGAKGFYTLHDVTGKLLLNGTVATELFNLDLSAFSKGIYFFSLHDGQKQVHRKIIKE